MDLSSGPGIGIITVIFISNCVVQKKAVCILFILQTVPVDTEYSVSVLSHTAVSAKSFRRVHVDEIGVIVSRENNILELHK